MNRQRSLYALFNFSRNRSMRPAFSSALFAPSRSKSAVSLRPEEQVRDHRLLPHIGLEVVSEGFEDHLQVSHQRQTVLAPISQVVPDEKSGDRRTVFVRSLV